MSEFFHQAASILVIILLCIGAFGILVLGIALICHTIGKIVLGQRFEDWWDRTFWF